MSGGDEMIDRGAKTAYCDLHFPGAKEGADVWKKNETRVLGFDSNALSKILGVNGDASLFRVHSFDTTDAATHGQFIVNFSHSPDVNDPDRVAIAERHVHVMDGGTHASMAHRAYSPHIDHGTMTHTILPTDHFLSLYSDQKAADLPLRRIMRYRKNNGNGALYSPEEIGVGVKKFTHDGETKYLIKPTGADGRESVLSRFVKYNIQTNPNDYNAGAYKDGKRVEITDEDGQTGILMEAAHFENAKKLIQKSLEVEKEAPLHKGFWAHVTNIGDDTKTGISFGIKFNRTPLDISAIGAPYTKMKDIQTKLNVTDPSKPQKVSGPIFKQVFPRAKDEDAVSVVSLDHDVNALD